MYAGQQIKKEMCHSSDCWLVDFSLKNKLFTEKANLANFFFFKQLEKILLNWPGTYWKYNYCVYKIYQNNCRTQWSRSPKHGPYYIFCFELHYLFKITIKSALGSGEKKKVKIHKMANLKTGEHWRWHWPINTLRNSEVYLYYLFFFSCFLLFSSYNLFASAHSYQKITKAMLVLLLL